jgi:dipicolinate synthase subunit A
MNKAQSLHTYHLLFFIIPTSAKKSSTHDITDAYSGLEGGISMDPTVFYIDAGAPALNFAAEYLRSHGMRVVSSPSPKVTHLLLPVPTGLSEESLETLLTQLPPDVTVLGGNLDRYRCRKLDLLKDETYLAENAAITADCALRLAGQHLGILFRRCPVLVIGWGRIGKCLSRMLEALGADVTVAARKVSDRAMAGALGYETADLSRLPLPRFRLIFNTAPAPVLSAQQLQTCPRNCVKIDLASSRGLEGDDVIWARGLPGKMLPESSGKLIADTAVRLISKEGSV